MLTLIARWAHMVAAIVLVGGLLYARLVLLPAQAETLEEPVTSRLRGAWRNHGELGTRRTRTAQGQQGGREHGSQAFDRRRRELVRWLFVTTTLALAVVLISGVLKNL